MDLSSVYENSNNLGILLTALERDTIYPKEIFTLANYTNLCRCIRELCERMGAKEFTAAFPTWQYSIREFRARTNTMITQTAGDGPTQSNVRPDARARASVRARALPVIV
jgi:hypothetical protein